MAKTILLADDSMTIQKVVELTFMDQDFEVTAVSDGGAAIAALDQTQPDIVIADVHMPTADGYAVCRHSKSKHAGTPVLLLVGTFEQFDEQQARQAGADGHLKKPFDSQELLQKVESMVADSGSAPAPPAPDAQPELTTQPAAPEPAAAPPAPEPTAPAPPAPEPAAPAPPAAPAAPQQSAPARDFTSPEPAPPAPQPAEQAAAAADIDDFTSPEPAPPSQDFTSPEPAAPAPEPAAATPATPAAPSPAETVAVSQPSAPEPATPEPGAADFAPSSAETRPRRAEAAAPADAGEAASAAGGNGDGSLSDEDVERIARKVVELAGGNVVKEIAWEVIPDLAEVVIRERIQELESEVD